MFSTLLHMLDTGGQALLRIVSFWHYVFTRHPENPLWGPSVAIPIIRTGGEESKDLNETWGYTKCYSRCFILTLWSMTLSLMVLESIIFFFLDFNRTLSSSCMHEYKNWNCSNSWKEGSVKGLNWSWSPMYHHFGWASHFQA